MYTSPSTGNRYLGAPITDETASYDESSRGLDNMAFILFYAIYMLTVKKYHPWTTFLFFQSVQGFQSSLHVQPGHLLCSLPTAITLQVTIVRAQPVHSVYVSRYTKSKWCSRTYCLQCALVFFSVFDYVIFPKSSQYVRYTHFVPYQLVSDLFFDRVS